MRFFLFGLTLLFIGLKLTQHIVWSWWWVLSPLWLPTVVAVAILLILAVFSQTFRTNFRDSLKRHQAEAKWKRIQKNLKFKDFEA